jgi:hypothetical protein
MKRSLVICCLVAGLIAGCGGGDDATPAASPHSTPTADATAENSPADLERAVRKAIEEDHRMSVSVLWTNEVPRHPTATAGPALALLRNSAAQRRRQHIRVRVLWERFRILSVDLDPSYTSATATVLDLQRTQPSDANGKPLGKSVRVNERAQVVLHRVGTDPRFVVWKVTLAR